MTAMTMNYRGSLKGGGTLLGDKRWCDGPRVWEHDEHKRDKGRRCSRLVWPLGDRKRDMLQLHQAAESRSPRAPGPRPACAGRSPRAGALVVNAAPWSLPRQHFLHYFREEVSRGQRGMRTAENTLLRTRVYKG